MTRFRASLLIVVLTLVPLGLCIGMAALSETPRIDTPVQTPRPRTARDVPAIRAVMDYVPGREETILYVIEIVIAMSERTGNDIEVEGWAAIPRDEDWEVLFCFVENGTRGCATFWYDPQKGTVAPKDYRGKLFFDAAKAW